MSWLQVTFTYDSPAGEEVDWRTDVHGSDDAHALSAAVKEFERAHVPGLRITELALKSLDAETAS